MSTLIVGCGMLGRRVGRLLHLRGEPVFGTTRTPEKAAELAALGIEPVLANVLEPGTLAALPAADRVLYCVGFDRGAGVSMRTVYVNGMMDVLKELPLTIGRFVYASSTGVYGQGDGDWVDEDAATEPRHESGRVALEAETLARERSATVLRFAGLYGPGRIVRRAAIENGDVINGDPSNYLNLIHLDDAAAAAVRALDLGEPGRIYLASDDRPVERLEYYGLVARLLGAPAPRFQGPDPASQGESNKRVSNHRIKTELGLVLTYPDITTGVPAALAEST
ncbi:MAG: NAD-dependent epimerase/dehydratase family protein [Isosphaeraceae bacterium]